VTDGPPVRHAARAVVLDAMDRVFLFHNEIPERQRRMAWYLPGGGLEDGETHEEAVARELVEEIGLRDVEIGPCVWTRISTRFRGDVEVPSHSRFFLVRCECFDVDTAGGGVESSLEWRWWTLDELDAAPPRSFLPTSLPRLVRALLSGDIPAEPVDASD
jgi:8-oxo-dGTP pyrophosphatase MutT (NUDIX family)